MKRSKADTAQTRRRIVETAATEFRRHGIHATGLAEVMAAAGLSPGGFYRHFDSKADLVTEACAKGMEATVQTIEACAAKGGDAEAAYGAIVHTYLAMMANTDTAPECPFVGIGAELARTDGETRSAATRGFSDMTEVIAGQLRQGDPQGARSRAVFTLCAMIGAATMARIVDDPDLATTILRDTERLLAPKNIAAERPH
jgi:TetR/AcrR family transcriptional repressor of nem operon